VQEDIDRIQTIWRECRARFGAGGPFLFGDFTAVDAMFAPVASRLRTYCVELEGDEAKYAEAVLALPVVEEWMEDARKEPWRIARFDEA
jgi:glutathione S-transferase